MENDAERIREKVLRLIDLKYESDVSFERAADLPPKTVSNWRRGRSTSYMKQLAKIAPLLGIHAADFLLDAGSDDYGQRLLHLWRRTEVLPPEERAALTETLSQVIRLYLSTHHRDG